MLQLCCSVAALASKGEWRGLEGAGGEGNRVCVCVHACVRLKMGGGGGLQRVNRQIV